MVEITPEKGGFEINSKTKILINEISRFHAGLNADIVRTTFKEGQIDVTLSRGNEGTVVLRRSPILGLWGVVIENTVSDEGLNVLYNPDLDIVISNARAQLLNGNARREILPKINPTTERIDRARRQKENYLKRLISNASKENPTGTAGVVKQICESAGLPLSDFEIRVQPDTKTGRIDLVHIEFRDRKFVDSPCLIYTPSRKTLQLWQNDSPPNAPQVNTKIAGEAMRISAFLNSDVIYTSGGEMVGQLEALRGMLKLNHSDFRELVRVRIVPPHNHRPTTIYAFTETGMVLRHRKGTRGWERPVDSTKVDGTGTRQRITKGKFVGLIDDEYIDSHGYQPQQEIDILTTGDL